MNIDEAKRARVALEKKIQDAVTDFHGATGCIVSNIEVTWHEVRWRSGILSTVHKIKVRAELQGGDK